MYITNQNRQNHYSDDDNYGWPNKMCCPYMYHCPCMNQHMNYKSVKMNREQDEQVDNNPDSVNIGDFRKPMPWQKKLKFLINKPVGVSLKNGQGVSGILCSVSNGEIYLLEYLYKTQFATKHYPFDKVEDIHSFPKCHNQDGVY